MNPPPTPDQLVSLFPASATLGADGSLYVGGVSLEELAAEHGTPAYIVDVEEFRRQAGAFTAGMARRWPGSEVIFASKAFPAVAIYRLAHECGLSIDVSGGGEIVMALAAGVDPKRLYFHGNAKTDAELELALEAGVGTIIIDNADEFDRLVQIARRPQQVMVRVIPDVAPDTHFSQVTGGNKSKFGLPFDQAAALIERVNASSLLQLTGVHVHIGSQILDAAPFAQAVHRISMLGTFDCYDMGGGLGARYTFDEHPPGVDQYLDSIVDAARQVLPASARLLIEPGRSIVARAGMSLYRVVSVKRTGRTFVAVDGGMADNLDPALTRQRYEAVIVGRAASAPTVVCDVVGRHCESGDLLIQDAMLADPQVGDVLAIPVTGAYSYTMVNHYNGAPHPPVVFVENGTSRVTVRRETYDDLLRTHLP